MILLSDLYLYGLLALVLAVAIDLLLGEPPNAAHPVVWIGKVIGFMDRHTKRTGRKRTDRAKGILLALVPLLLFPFLFTLLLFLLRDLFDALVWAIGCAILLKTMFAINAMGKHTRPIQKALENGDMDAARKAASMIVSRDVTSWTGSTSSPVPPSPRPRTPSTASSPPCSSSAWAVCP
jgi:adenosylcobinamide-phosphate synthase